MKEIAFALDLVDDPAVISDYVEWHRKVWPEIMRGMADVGVLSQNIYLIGNRLFMVLQVEDDFDYARDFGRYLEKTPRAGEWDTMMRKLQRIVPWAGEGELWAHMERVYDLNAQLSAAGGRDEDDPGSGGGHRGRDRVPSGNRPELRLGGWRLRMAGHG